MITLRGVVQVVAAGVGEEPADARARHDRTPFQQLQVTAPASRPGGDGDAAERERDERERDERERDERERDERDRDERNAWRQCPDCLLYTRDADHVCVTYDGPACGTCGEPTALFTVDAPGYGTGRTCRNGHGEYLTRDSFYTGEQNR